MALSKHDRKEILGHGGLTRIARRIKRTAGHVAEVNAERRRDATVERAITREILRRRPDISPSDIWPDVWTLGGRHDAAQNGGKDVADSREHESEPAGAR